MDKDNKRARIKAAQDWLGQADDSLDKADDLKGDLKLLLAKAELEGAVPGRKTRNLRKWLSRGAALGMALAIVVLAENWQSLQERNMENVQVPAAVTADETSPVVEEKSAAVTEAKEAEAPEPESPPEHQIAEQPLPAAQPDVDDGSQRLREGMMEAGSPQAAVSPHLTYEAPRVPAPDKQKLMQEAGEVLRR